MSDALVTAIVAGDTVAFGQWMRGAERPLRDSLRRFAASVDTEAVLQETLLRIWQVAPRFRSDGKPNGLLRLATRIARNLAVSEIRKTQRLDPLGGEGGELERRLAALEHFEPPSPPDPHLRGAIERCRDRLPSKPRIALEARLDACGGEPDATLAERVAMQKNTFLQNITRARKYLAECLRKQGVDLEQELA